MADYTDEDWHAVRGVLVSGPFSGASETTTKVLDAVAPAIVARAKAEALREAATELFPTLNVWGISVADVLRERADIIERGQS